MPTAAKLFAAVAFAAVAFFAAEAIKPLMPEGTQFGLFSPICALVGALCGWIVMGPLAGRGYYAAAGSGLRTSITVVFWCLVIFALEEMVQESMRLRYDGPMDALVGAFEIAARHVKTMAAVDVLGILLVGGILAGVFAEWGSKRWR